MRDKLKMTIQKTFDKNGLYQDKNMMISPEYYIIYSRDIDDLLNRISLRLPK